MKLFHWIMIFLIAACGAGLVGFAENAHLSASNYTAGEDTYQNSKEQSNIENNNTPNNGDEHQYHIKKENIKCPKCGMHTSLDFEYQDRYTFYCSQCSTIFEVW
jgi:formamidopyrimidine-DNA glycosylase